MEPLFAKGDDNGGMAWGLDLIPADANNMSMVALLYGNMQWVVTSSFPYSLTNWHHIVAVMSASSGQQIYVDGVLQGMGDLPVFGTAAGLGLNIARTTRGYPYTYWANG